ncbi:MAG: choice-of-anchor D domain-containing protein [Pseudomonadota bacterium]
MDFASLTAGQTLVEPVILRNITSIPINITDIYIDSSAQAGYSLKTECKQLEPGQACIATISWSPRLRGPASGVLVVEHDGPTGLSSVSIRGEYTPDSVQEAEVFPEAVPGKGLLVSSQSEVDFGSGIEAASTITVSLVNAGDADVTLQDISLGGSDNGLSVKENGCSIGQVLEPIEACPLTLSWSPTRAGELIDDIQIVHDGARGILILPIRGDADNAVSKDQGTVLLASTPQVTIVDPSSPDETRSVRDDEDEDEERAERRERRDDRRDERNRGRGQEPARNFFPTVSNPASVLDGLTITSFSPNRAIVAGPSGSRIVFDDEEIVLGGLPWDVNIQRNGIEFTHAGQTVLLLLFDRSLSSVNRNASSSGSSSSVSSSSTSDDE